MIPCMISKIEETNSIVNDNKIKLEGDCKNEESSVFVTIKEEEAAKELNPEYLKNIPFCWQKEFQFSHHFENLNQYLDSFIRVEDFEVPHNFENDSETKEAISKAKLYFKEHASKIIRTMAENFRFESLSHSCTEAYITNVVEATKRRIFGSYKSLKRNLTEILISQKDNSHVGTEEKVNKPKKTIRKSKYDFPVQAQALLRSWFVAHAKDPYPSHEEKVQLARKGGISMKQLDNWLTNTRGRIWKQTQKHEASFQKQIAKVLQIKKEDFLQIPSSL